MNWAFILGWIVSACAGLAGASSVAQLNTLFGEDGASKIAAASGLLGFILGIPLGYLNAKGQIVRYVADNLQDPTLKRPIVQAVANLQGVAEVPIDIRRADPVLKEMAVSSAPENTKIVTRR